MSDNRKFLVVATNFCCKEVGSIELDIHKDSEFVDAVRIALNAVESDKEKPKRIKPDEDFTVEVYKYDTRGHKRLVNSMDITLPSDSDFEEILDLTYHGCTDED